MTMEIALKGFSDLNHGLDRKVVASAEEFGDVGLLFAEPVGQLRPGDAEGLHPPNGFLGEFVLGTFNPVVEALACLIEQLFEAVKISVGAVEAVVRGREFFAFFHRNIGFCRVGRAPDLLQVFSLIS